MNHTGCPPENCTFLCCFSFFIAKMNYPALNTHFPTKCSTRCPKQTPKVPYLFEYGNHKLSYSKVINNFLQFLVIKWWPIDDYNSRSSVAPVTENGQTWAPSSHSKVYENYFQVSNMMKVKAETLASCSGLYIRAENESFVMHRFFLRLKRKAKPVNFSSPVPCFT